MKRPLLGLSVLCSAGALLAAGPLQTVASDAKALLQARRTARAVYNGLKEHHLTQRAPDDFISRRAWTNVLDACDGGRMLFLADDIAAFEKKIDSLDDALRAGDFSFALEVRDVGRARLAERVAFATNFLAQGVFDFSGEYAFARDRAPWPATPAARDRLWTQRLTSDVLDEWLDCETGGVARAASVVATNYVDLLAGELKRKPLEVCDAFIHAVAAAYDAHSLYMSGEEYASFQSSMDLTLCGIGAEWSLRDGLSKIKRVMPGGPLAKDGRVHAGDFILRVAPHGDGRFEPVAGKSESEVLKLFRGEKGTKITLEIRHPDGAVEQVTLVRDDVPLDDEAASSQVVTVDIAGEPRPVGYLRLPSFYASMPARGRSMRSCAEDLRAELEKLRAAKVCGVLFDLRDNNGGSLDDAVKVVGLFVRQGPAVRMRSTGGETSLPVPDGDVVCDVPVLVLTSRGSASAGELVPASLQDLGRAVVAGDARTFGKGSAQTVIPFDDDEAGAVTITDARFYRVTGGSTQFKGVAADILLPSCCDDELWKGEQGLVYPLPWDELAPGRLTPSWDLDRFIPELRTASAARLAKNAAWQKHLRLVADSEDLVRQTTVPLDKAARRGQLDRADAVEDEIERLMDEGYDPAHRDRDLVLDEGLNILADLVRLNGGRTLPAARPLSAVDPSFFGGLNDDE